MCKPDALSMINQDIKFSELSTFTSIEEAKKHLIWREIDLLLRNSHIEHLKWLEKKCKINGLTTDNKWLLNFIEVTERRNLFVHNDGIVNKQYIGVCE